MSDEQQNRTDEDVEAHRRRAANDEQPVADEEPGEDDGDVEAHVFKM
jgi:hypothetical protein